MKDEVKAYKTRLLTKLLKEVDKQTQDYRNTIRHTGGLLTNSMVYAYSKGFTEAIKLIGKDQDEEPAQSVKTESSPETVEGDRDRVRSGAV